MEESRADKLSRLIEEKEVTRLHAALEVQDAYLAVFPDRDVSRISRLLINDASEYAVDVLRFVDTLLHQPTPAYTEEAIERALRATRIYREARNRADTPNSSSRRVGFVPETLQHDELVREMVWLGVDLSMEDNAPGYWGEEYGEEVKYNKYGKVLPY